RAAEPPPPAAPLVDLSFPLGTVRQRLVGRDAGKACDLGGLDLEHVVNFAGDVAEPTLAAFETLFGPRRLLARGTHCFERRALGAVGLGEPVLALRELIGRVPA